MKGTGRAVFVAILLLIAGTLNIIYGFGAIGNATLLHREPLVCVREPPHLGVDHRDPRC